MLVLTRKDGQKLLFSNGIVITVCQTKTGSVRLGVEAPKDVKILREELQEAGLCTTQSASSTKTERSEPK